MQWFRHTFFPTPLYVGTLTGGSTDAGLPNRTDEKVTMATSEWTNLVTNLDTGNHLVTVDLVSIPSASGLPMNLQLVHNSMNASVDIGVGKGWMTNLHTCVSEDQQTGDITYLDPSGAQYIFEYDSGSQTYSNPKGFAGQLTKEANGTYTLQTLGHVKYTFNSNGKLNSISETCGTTTDSIAIGYNANGDPITITDSLSNRSITLTWDGSDNLTQVSDPMSHSWNLTQNASDQLTTIQQPQDNSQSPPPTPPSCGFTYTNDRITGHTDFLGDSYTIAYAASSPYKVTSWTDPASKQTSFAYTTASTPYDHKSTVTDAESIATDYYFGATSGELEKIEQVSGATTLKIEMGYNTTTGFQTTSKDSYGNTTTIAYDSVGHVATITYPPAQQGQSSYVKTFMYSTPISIDSNVTQVQETVTDQQNATTTYQYTDNNNPCLPTSITNPLNQTTTKQYNSHGQVTSVTQPTTGGTKTTQYSYNSTTGDLIKKTDALGNETQYLRNLNGLVSEIKVYDGTVSTGTLVADTTISLSVLNTSTGTSDSVSGLTSAQSDNANGATLSTTSTLGCTNSVSLKDAMQASMPSKMFMRAPSKNIGSIQFPTIPAPRFPMDPYQPLPASSTNTQGNVTAYVYKNNGSISTTINHLAQATNYSYDLFGRTSGVADPFGKNTSYGYDLNSQVTSKTVTGEGTTSYVYDNVHNLQQITEPIKGTNILTRNLRGDLVLDTYASYSRDLLGRVLSKTFTAGGSETYSYSPEGYLTNDNGIQYTFDAIGNVTSKNGTSLTYTGATGSQVLGLPSSSTNQSYSYRSNHFLSTLTDTSKSPSQTFQYQYSPAKELTFLSHPNQVQLQQIFTNKEITSQTYVHTPSQTQYSQINQTFNGNNQLTQYQYNIANGGTPFTETYTMTHTANNQLNTVTYGSNNQVLTYGYNGTGKLSTLSVSGLGQYTYNYHPTNGTITSVTYPNSTQESYTYNGPQGRLSQVSYPNGDTVSMNWNGKMQVQSITYSTALINDVYTFQYDGQNRTTSYTLTQNGTQSFRWEFGYDGLGIRTATKYMNGQTAITHVFTTDTSGRPVSTTYQDNTCQTSCFAGEAQLQWDPCGNLTSMTDASGTLLASFEYDKAYSYKTNEYNPNQIEIPFQFDGRDGTITPTYGGATPVNIDIQIKNGQSFHFRNTKPLQAMRIFKCYVNGYSPDPMSPADGGPSDGCSDEGEGGCDLDCEKGYKEGFTSITDLCRCKAKDGKIEGIMYNRLINSDCDELKEEMESYKNDWYYHVNGPETGDLDTEDKYHGKIENAVDVLFYIGNPNKDYPCGTLARDGCNYWIAKEELEKRQAKGDCL